ncbi:MAG: sugar phosphate isomerase/epimerase [Planctomycetota bacterium]|nr:sugar phosphate isomerase/epimerase [Planctomycetota bacterium]
MKLGAFTTFTPEYTFPEACRLIKSIGYDGVQPRIVPDASAGFDPSKPFNPWGNNKGGIAESAFFEDPQGALKPAKDAGLQISSVASYTNTNDMERAVKMVRACGKAGIRNVRVGAGLPIPKDKPQWDALKLVDESKARYKELVAEANKAGVRPCLELHGGTLFPGPSGTANFLRGFTPEQVGILYDPANMLSDGWERLDLSLNLMGDFLAEVHVKNSVWVRTGADANGVAQWKAQSAELEDGCVYWPEIIAQLKKRGYDGWLVEEGHTDSASHKRLATAFAHLKRMLGA